MVEGYLSILNVENISKLLGLTFLIMCLIGITSFSRNIEKLGE